MSQSLAVRAEVVEEQSQWRGEPWSQQPGESNLWFSRFEAYLRMGPKRSIDKTYRLQHGYDKQPSGAWCSNAVHWRWIERAQAWDAAELEKEREQFEAYCKAARDARIAAMFTFHQKTTERLETLKPEELEWKDVRENLKVAHSDMRQEFGDAPTGSESNPIVVRHRHEISAAERAARVDVLLDAGRTRRARQLASGRGPGDDPGGDEPA